MGAKAVRRFGREPRGFNVIELITTVSIIAIVSAIGIPGIVGGVQRTGVDGAARRLADDIRLAQSSALMQGVQARLIVFNSSGVAANPGSTDITSTAHADMYRIETRSSATASWPLLTDYPGGSGNVTTVWYTLNADYKNVSIATGNTIIFNSQGFLTNPSFLDVVLQGPGGTKTVRTSVIGKATIQ
jgi:prepilin-type N-terminal cleavage/methylation domain-containing protein